MLPLILTGFAGVALGVVVMRLLQATPVTRGDQEIVSSTVASTDGEPDTPKTNLLGRYSRNQLTFGGAGALALVAVAILSFRSGGESALTASAVSSPAAGAGAPALDDVDTMISRLEARLQKEPNNGEGFRMLGWSLQNTGKPAEAVMAYGKAAKLLPGRADVHAGYGEALVAVAKDVVTPEAKEQFDKAISIDPNEPRARFFASLYKAQNGDERAALSEWIALSNSAAPDQPWQADVHQRITKIASKLGVNIAGQLKPLATPALTMPALSGTSGGPDAAAVKAAGALSEPERASMINNMVDGLAAKLQANPGDFDGWVKLIRSRMVLKDAAKAKDDLGMARKAFASDPQKLSQINALASELGL
jgi:cytochrome c-type biogenesis protein CcmH